PIFFVQASHIAFQHVHDIFLSNKGHFQVDLSKLWLTVCTQVLVTEASCKLDIAVETGQHQKLFVDLWGLRQRIEFSMMDSGWNQIVSCAFRCGLDEHWSLDFQKVILIEIISGSLCNLMTQNHLFLQGLSSQVEVTVFEAEFLFCLALVGDFKWRGLCFGQ